MFGCLDPLGFAFLYHPFITRVRDVHVHVFRGGGTAEDKTGNESVLEGEYTESERQLRHTGTARRKTDVTVNILQV